VTDTEREYTGIEYTTVQERMGSYSGLIAIMADYLGLAVANVNVAIATACWNEACQEADAYCQNDFAEITEARPPFTGVKLPTGVQSFVIVWACRSYVRRIPGTVEEVEGAVTLKSADETTAVDKARFLYPYRKSPGL